MSFVHFKAELRSVDLAGFAYFDAFSNTVFCLESKCDEQDHEDMSSLPVRPLLEFLAGRRDVSDLVSPLLYASASPEAAVAVLKTQKVRTDLAIYSWSRSRVPLLLSGDVDVDVDSAMAGFDGREVTRILAELDVTERWTDVPIDCDNFVLAQTAGPVFASLAEWPSDAVVAGGAVLHAAEGLGRTSDLDVFVGCQESAERMSNLLQRSGYCLHYEREDACFAADFEGCRVQVILHPKASVPSALVRRFDLFASEAYWLPHSRQGFATASALYDWRTRMLHGGRNDLRQSRFNKYVAKGFRPGTVTPSSLPCLESQSQSSSCEVRNLEDYSVFVRSAHKIQPWEPSSLVLRRASDLCQLQTPWVYCLREGRRIKELLLDRDCPSHRALLMHIDELRVSVGVSPGNSIVRVCGDGRQHERGPELAVGRFRGCLMPCSVPPRNFNHIELRGSTAVINPGKRVQDMIFQLENRYEARKQV